MTDYHSIYAEIDKIIEQVNQETFSFSKFDGDSCSWKRIELPSDFEYLIASVANLLNEDNPTISAKSKHIVGLSSFNRLATLAIKYSKSEGSSIRFQEQESPSNFEKEKVSWFTCSIILSISA